MSAQELHLYVHLPFCMHKCAYCDFNSHVRDAPPWDDYRQALLAELDAWTHHRAFAGRPVATLFFGGGTPSLAPPELIGAVIETAHTHFNVVRNCEITLEANPGTTDAARFTAYRSAGVNRLSIGVQSFNDEELHWLERIHDARAARAAFAAARDAGFENISLDLMYGLPGQRLNDWLAQINSALALSPHHLSCYQLTVEPHTELAARHRRHPLRLPNDEQAVDFLRRTRETLAASGFQAYEISNFARPGFRCRHNDGYWLYHDYLGLGAGAAGKYDTDDGGIIRYANVRSPEGYIKAVMQRRRAVNSEECLTREKAAAEALWLGLRRSEGIHRSDFARRFGRDVFEIFGAALAPWRKRGCLNLDVHGLRLTERGLPLADSIAADILQASD